MLAITETPLLGTVGKSPAEAMLNALKHYHGLPLFYCSTLVDVFFSGHNMKVKDFLNATLYLYFGFYFALMFTEP